MAYSFMSRVLKYYISQLPINNCNKCIRCTHASFPLHNYRIITKYIIKKWHKLTTSHLNAAKHFFFTSYKNKRLSLFPLKTNKTVESFLTINAVFMQRGEKFIEQFQQRSNRGGRSAMKDTLNQFNDLRKNSYLLQLLHNIFSRLKFMDKWINTAILNETIYKMDYMNT